MCVRKDEQQNLEKIMTTFKLEKKENSLNIEWHYRDFIIENKVSYLNTYPMWGVKCSNGPEIYSHGPGTRTERSAWVDGYYQDMNEFVNSNEFNEIGE
jgi:hypothetical protein